MIFVILDTLISGGCGATFWVASYLVAGWLGAHQADATTSASIIGGLAFVVSFLTLLFVQGSAKRTEQTNSEQSQDQPIYVPGWPQ